MTEDHKVRCSIHLLGAFFLLRQWRNRRRFFSVSTKSTPHRKLYKRVYLISVAMSAVAIRMPSLFSRVGVPMLHSSCVLGCTLFAGDLLGQAVSSKTDHMSFWWLRVICSDMKRSLFVGVSGFLFSGPLSFFVHRMVFKLYPGNGRLTGLSFWVFMIS